MCGPIEKNVPTEHTNLMAGETTSDRSSGRPLISNKLF